MIASLLPLPMNPVSEMQERDGSMSNLDSSNDISNDFARRFSSTDEARYESAKWWRSLNRWMSLVGLLIITAVVSWSSSMSTSACNSYLIGGPRCFEYQRGLVNGPLFFHGRMCIAQPNLSAWHVLRISWISFCHDALTLYPTPQVSPTIFVH